MKSKTINLRVSDEFLEALDSMCAINGLDRTKMIEALVWSKHWEGINIKARMEAFANEESRHGTGN